jgi:4'-phosphopantetheinyl transferase
MIEIFAVKLLDQNDFLNKKTKFLNELPFSLSDKFKNYSHNKNLQRTIFGELLSRHFIANKIKIESNKIEFNIGDKGKPFLENSDIHFNVSHSGEWVVAAFSKRNIGIDIEIIREPNYNVAKRFFSSVEIHQLNIISDADKKKNLFFDFWTVKESYLKAIGTGLTKPLNTFTVVKNADSIQLVDNENDNLVFVKQYSFIDNYKLSVCAFENEFDDKVNIIEF